MFQIFRKEKNEHLSFEQSSRVYFIFELVFFSPYRQRLVVHLDGLDFSGDVLWGEGDDHAWLDDTSLHTSDGDSSNA